MTIASVHSSLHIQRKVLNAIQAAARAAGSHECMGLMAVDRDGDRNIVSAACLLPAKASGSHALAEPLVLARAVELLQRNHKVPVGLWHSHGNHSVFHSGTDDETVQRLFPALAQRLYRCNIPPVLVPAVTACDSAVLPLENGRMLRVTLIGSPIIGFDGVTERISWTNVSVGYVTVRRQSRVIRDVHAVTLCGAGVRLRLGMPEDAQISVVVEQPTSVLWATMWSLVVNRRGEQYTEVVVVHDHDGAPFISQERGEVVVVEANERAESTGQLRSIAAPLMLTPSGRRRDGEISSVRMLEGDA